MRNKKSILFIRPDYHCSFFLRDELRKLGWKADIYVPLDYPSNLLYSEQGILRQPYIKNSGLKLIKLINYIFLDIWWLFLFWKYEYHIYYGRPPATFFFERIGLNKLFGPDFVFELFLSKLFRVKLIYLPTGCHDEESKENYLKIDNGNLCNNCGLFDRCNDIHNLRNFAIVRRYFATTIGPGSIESTQLNVNYIKYKSISLTLWNPSLEIPTEYQLPPTNNLRILHSSYLKNSNRYWQGRDSKGSNYVLAAIERLKEEGYPIEYYFLSNISSKNMRFYQVQADIVVEQLLAGLWGSTGVETMALGKPVVCYLRTSWKTYFFKVFHEYKELPIVEANIETIYDVLKKLVTNKTYRLQKGLESRRFAEQHFNPAKNASSLINLLETL